MWPQVLIVLVDRPLNNHSEVAVSISVGAVSKPEDFLLSMMLRIVVESDNSIAVAYSDVDGVRVDVKSVI